VQIMPCPDRLRHRPEHLSPVQAARPKRGKIRRAVTKGRSASTATFHAREGGVPSESIRRSTSVGGRTIRARRRYIHSAKRQVRSEPVTSGCGECRRPAAVQARWRSCVFASICCYYRPRRHRRQFPLLLSLVEQTVCGEVTRAAAGANHAIDRATRRGTQRPQEGLL